MPTEYQSNWTTSAPTGYEDHSPVTTISTTMPQVTKCIHCGSQTASYYRTDQSGHLICNTCTSRSGLPPISRPPNRSTKAKTAQTTVNNNRRTGVVCANCNTSTTTLWRRNNSGDPVCNACGLYYKLHNVRIFLVSVLTFNQSPTISYNADPPTNRHEKGWSADAKTETKECTKQWQLGQVPSPRYVLFSKNSALDVWVKFVPKSR